MLLPVLLLFWFYACAAHLSLCNVKSCESWQWLECKKTLKAVLKHLRTAVITDT